MRETQPEIYLIARPAADFEGMLGYLTSVGGQAWLEQREQDPSNDAELLVEFCGRACYRSWTLGLNANISRIRTDRRAYLSNLISSGHGSVLEHATWTFAFRNVSRVFTHELVRHRAGSAFSQESLRYVRLAEIGFRLPPPLEPMRQRVVHLVEELEEFQRDAASALDLDSPELPFDVKKEITSALRRLAPLGLSTDIIWTANARTLRHVVELRSAAGAEEEMRLVFSAVGDLMRREAPALFEDFRREADGSWATDKSKV